MVDPAGLHCIGEMGLGEPTYFAKPLTLPALRVKRALMLTNFLIIAGISCVLGAWVYSIAFLALLVENHRFWKVHQKKPAPLAHTYARANIIIPCKGMEHQLRENLTAFMQQDHPNYEVTFVVERTDDSSVQLIRNVQKENRCVRSRLIVAGRTEQCGQKVHNLRCATAELSKEVDVLVFADSDASPKRTWLRWLVNSVGREGLGARTGYRWMVPKNKKLPTLLGCTINNALASFLGRGKHYLVWGGSWAIHRNVFDAVGIREAWSGVLSDDLVATRALRSANLDVEFEPQCVCTSAVEFTWGALTEFLRRQLLISRRYAPFYWFTSLVVTTIATIGFWGGLVAGIVAIAAGASWGYWVLGSSIGLYLMGVARAAIRQNIGRSNCPSWRSYRRAKKFDLFAGPLTALVSNFMLLMSTVGNVVTWRGITYFVGRGGRVILVGRSLGDRPWPVNTQESPDPRMESQKQQAKEPVASYKNASNRSQGISSSRVEQRVVPTPHFDSGSAGTQNANVNPNVRISRGAPSDN
jgi:hypothetical protein